MKNYFTIFLIGICTSFLVFSFAQDKSSGFVNADLNPDQTFTGYKNDLPLSAKDQLLLNQITEIKNSGDVSRQEELKDLLKEFNRRNGLTENPAEPYNGQVFYSPENGA